MSKFDITAWLNHLTYAEFRPFVERCSLQNPEERSAQAQWILWNQCYYCDMKTIYLIRHAKSDWSDTTLRDFDRPLNIRGLHDAPFMAEKLSSRIKSVDKIITSPAIRAKTTAGFFAKEFGIPVDKVQCETAIYDATTAVLLKVINEMKDSHQHIIMVGHNPGFSNLVAYLTDAWIEMPTCSIAEIQLGVNSWALVSHLTCKLRSFDFPKNYL